MSSRSASPRSVKPSSGIHQIYTRVWNFISGFFFLVAGVASPIYLFRTIFTPGYLEEMSLVKFIFITLAVSLFVPIGFYIERIRHFFSRDRTFWGETIIDICDSLMMIHFSIVVFAISFGVFTAFIFFITFIVNQV